MTEKPTTYDLLLYATYAHHRSHPDTLATIGKLFGQHPTPIDRCRVLELGCGSGGNLIPMAFNLPDSRFVGIDLSSRSIDLGQQVCSELGLDNIAMECRDIALVGEEVGAYDYILCHGVYSWVGEEVRRRILTLCRDHLKSNGIAYISYNVYPGWHQHEMLREMLRYHTAGVGHPAHRVRLARQMLEALRLVADDESDPRALFLRGELSHLEAADDSYLFHEYLIEENRPVYFHEFVEQAEAQGLRYLGDAAHESMFVDNQREPCAGYMKRSRDVIQAQQYLDFFTNRRFRYSLLCPAGQSIDLNLVPQIIYSMCIRATFEPNPALMDRGAPEPIEIVTAGGNSASVVGQALRLALSILSEVSPGAIPFRTLMHEVAQRIDDPWWSVPQADDYQSQPEWRDLAAHLTRLYFAGIVAFHTHTSQVCNEVSSKPQASRLARTEAKTRKAVTNQWHQTIFLDPFARTLIQLLDGSRALSQLKADLKETEPVARIPVKGQARTQGAGEPAQDEGDPTDRLEEALDRLRRQALLVG